MTKLHGVTRKKLKPFAARTAEAFSAIHELNFALQSGKSAAVAEEVKGKGNWSSEIHKEELCEA